MLIDVVVEVVMVEAVDDLGNIMGVRGWWRLLLVRWCYLVLLWWRWSEV